MSYSANDRIRLIDAQAEHLLANKTTKFGRMADEMDALDAELSMPNTDVFMSLPTPSRVLPGQTRFQALMAATQDADRPRSGDEDSQGRVFDPEIGEYV